MSTTIFVTLEAETCYRADCGITFGLEKNHQKRLIETHGTFYCPMGHSQRYIGKTEAERLRDELVREKHRTEQEQARKQFWVDQAAKKDRRVVALKGHLTRHKRRAAHGVCPCCSRTFKNVARHMAGQHPGFVEVADRTK